MGEQWQRLKRKGDRIRLAAQNRLHPGTIYFRSVVAPRILDRAPQPVAAEGEGPWEVHVLCGSQDVVSLFWSLHSLLAVCPDPPSLVVHDDGTLGDDWQGKLKAHFPGMRLVTRAEADARAEEVLKAWPKCHELRLNRRIAMKFFDYPVWAGQEWIGNVDSDILFFESPTDLIQWADREAPPRMGFHRDIFTTYGPLVKPLRKRDHDMPIRINSGLSMLHAPSLSLDRLEAWLEWPEVAAAVDAVGVGHLLGDQLLLALYSGAIETGFFTEDIGVPWQGARPAVACHYTRAVRPLLYLHGIRRLQGSLLGG